MCSPSPSCPGLTRASTTFGATADGRGWPGQARPRRKVEYREFLVAGPLVVVADETPFAQDLLHLHVVLHPLDRGGEGGDQLDVGLAEGIAAIAVRVLEGTRLVVLD